MVVVASYVAYKAANALADQSHPDETLLGLLLAAISLVVLPWLGRAKLRVAAMLASPSLRGDAFLTLAAAALSGITLAALAANSILGWWWLDPIAALVIAVALAAEAVRVAVRHRLG